MLRFQSQLSIHFPRNQFCQIAKFSKGSSAGSDKRRHQIGKILDRVKARDGLKSTFPHVQYLIGRTTEVGRVSRSLELGDKTQAILQSSHPVRYIIQREIKNLDSEEKLTYHNWVTILGRSLVTTKRTKENENFQSQLDFIANAADSGMFSSDVHHTVLDIPSEPSRSHLPAQIHQEMNLGNKYAALVGDYFAVKAIFFAERARRSQVILSITRGVEDFTSAGFSTRLVDPQVWTPFIPFPQATPNDWAAYNVKASGYFTGGCYAVLNVLPRTLLSASNIMKLVTNLTLFLKTVNELDDLCNGMEEDSMISPFLLTSLPGILYQQLHPNAYDVFQFRNYHKDYPSLTSELSFIHGEILSSDVIQQTIELIHQYAQVIKSEILSIAPSEFYSSAFRDLVDVITNTSTSNHNQ